MTSSSNESVTSATASGDLSRTTSFIESLVSMKTEEHDELYDHRQHTDWASPQATTPLKPIHVTGIPENGPNASLNNSKPSNQVRARSSTNQLRVDTSSRRRLSLYPEDEIKRNPTPVQQNHHLNSHLKPAKSPNRTTHGPSPIYHNDSSSPHSHNLKPHNSNSSEPQQSKLRSRANSIISIHTARSDIPQEHLRRVSSDNPPPKVKGSNPNPNQQQQQQRRASVDSEDSQASRDSQETEEDVCFPMSPQLHTRINGIDFDELEEFAEQSNRLREEYLVSLSQKENSRVEITSNDSTTSSSRSSLSSAALKYTPRNVNAAAHSNSNSDELNEESSEPYDLEKQLPIEPVPQGISFGANKIEDDDEICPIGTGINASSNNVSNKNSSSYGSNSNNSNEDISTPTEFYNSSNTYGGYECPTRFAFICSESGETVHATDIASLVKPGESFANLFRNGKQTWWLDCSCPTDDEMRCIAKTFGIHPLTAEDIRMQETREKVELFKSYYFVCFHTFENDKESEEYLEPINVYMVIFRTGILTFHFAPISHCANVRRRVRQLRDYVDVNADWLCYALIDDITDSFAPVIQSIEYEADTVEDSVFMTRDTDFSMMLQRIGESRRKIMTLMRLLSGKADVIKMFAKRCKDEMNGIGPALTSQINIANLQASSVNYHYSQTIQPRGDIALYLGDIQDHLLTMFQNLSSYEKIFSRSHANYLAQLQVESFNSNNRVTEILSKVTILGTMLVPLNVITGLFGMNVKVPGSDAKNYGWWFGILGVLLFLAVIGWFFATFWVKLEPQSTFSAATESGAKSIITNFLPRGVRRGKRDNNNRYAQRSGTRSNLSFTSLPSKYSRYN
ncbi:hypothetical protein TBLA_0A07910 [Henningerozyma blattae CBS 6284]|uniref:Magnesium transporter n=1 Tax=Henningerozyma blattae (strain ATCC 34711 / CBS 6284 / DSM 70876 / NBRC 10599 / NRRL Y-10934 / UCD 77-7) TaxID=1071380 RepID=I2GWS8_HENB6|nr:hypothetical protein TBLA_0A07910 [Tetrapisispora blattae CBS 6284]CCH58580.1 hypothetical protein TBLA_0A07910 [Tetrapisispora blattae CBS 6284]